MAVNFGVRCCSEGARSRIDEYVEVLLLPGWARPRRKDVSWLELEERKRERVSWALTGLKRLRRTNTRSPNNDHTFAKQKDLRHLSSMNAQRR